MGSLSGTSGHLVPSSSRYQESSEQYGSILLTPKEDARHDS